MKIDVNQFRRREAELHGFDIPDFKMEFYYDETGNARKFRLKKSGVNSMDAAERDYVLGGIAFECEESKLDIDDLFKRIRLQPTVKELKYNQLVSGHKDLWKGLNRNSLTEFIVWLEEKPVYIHYATLNNLYYATVDIVDSIWEIQPQFCFSPEWVNMLKASFYEVVYYNQNEFYSILKKYSYPDVENEDIKDFCMKIINFIENYGDSTDFYIECFRQMLKTNARQGKLKYAQGEEKGELVSEYYMLRVSRCYMFKNSIHHFDIEKEDMKMMTDVRLFDDEIEIHNYDFLESVDNRLIQISDAVVGLLSKIFYFIDNTTESEFSVLMAGATSIQRKNLRTISELIDRSEKKHITLIQNLNDISITRRRGRFLEAMQTIE